MRALILLDDTVAGTCYSPGDTYPRAAANCCHSMGIKVSYMRIAGAGAATNPTVAQMKERIDDIGADMVIIPTMNSNNRVAWGAYQTGIATLGVPMFALCQSDYNNTYSPGLATTNSRYPSSAAPEGAVARVGEYVRTGGATYSYNSRFLLKTTLVAPAVVTALIQGTGSDVTAVSAFKYTPDGTHYVYTHLFGASTYHNLFHFLLQEAIEDGVLSAPPIKAPFFLTIDDFNNGGDTNLDGTKGQPEIVSNLGEVLRSAGAICYGSMKRDQFSIMNATQKANFLAYNDVLKLCASHDHLTQHLTANGVANSAIASQRSKADIDAVSYQPTKTAIEGIGCAVETSFMHFAQNSVGTNFYDLAQRSTDISADPAGVTAMAGYGAKMMRIGTDYDNRYSYPPMRALDWIWQYKPVKYRGIVMVPSTDGGTSITRGTAADNAETILLKNYYAFALNLYPVAWAQLIYWHEPDFEDATLTTTTPLLSDEVSNLGRGLLSFQLGAAYQAACADTINWGANVDDYIP